MNKIQNFFFWVPNFITSMNLVSGSVAVFLGVEGELGWAAILIIAASVFDFSDGMAARLLKSYSEVGKQMDSLADLVSFGLAPAAILLSMLKMSMFGINLPTSVVDATLVQWIFLLSALLVPVAGAFRLAKFNIDTRQSESFLGLPIPSNALFFASLALIVQYGGNGDIVHLILNRFNLVTAIILFSALMISEIPMFSLKVKNLKWKDNQVRFMFLALCLILIILLQLYSLPLIIISYILISIIRELAG